MGRIRTLPDIGTFAVADDTFHEALVRRISFKA
jgi:hypothetical protein